MVSGMARPDYIVDIAGVETAGSLGVDGARPQPAARGVTGSGRPWLAILWRCCRVYGRAYRNAAGTAYEARCPRCSKPVLVRIGDGGTNCRFFETD
jgi:hypothetical protein